MRTTKMHEEEEERKLRLRRQARSAAKSGGGRNNRAGDGARLELRKAISIVAIGTPSTKAGSSAFHFPPHLVVGVHSGIT